MWIKIKDESINFDNVTNYKPISIPKRDMTGRNTGGYVKHLLEINTVNEDDNFGGVRIEYNTSEEVLDIVKKLDELFYIKSL